VVAEREVWLSSQRRLGVVDVRVLSNTLNRCRLSVPIDPSCDAVCHREDGVVLGE
jgi:hypothetical protein